MNVAHFETRALSGQAARSQGRETALVRDFAQRIGLIHELRQLRRAEELLDNCRSRLVVHQLLRHQRFDVLQAHPLFDRALHPDQPDAELVLDQLSDRTHAAIAEMVDIVDLAVAVLELHQVAHDFEDVLAAQSALLERHVNLELVIQLEPADFREIVALGVEEQVVEEGGRRFLRRRIAGPQAPVNLDDRLFGRAELVLREREAERSAAGRVFGEERFDFFDAVRFQLLEGVFGQLLVGADQHLAGGGIDDVVRRDAADDLVERNRHFAYLRLLHRADDSLVELAAFARDHLARLGILDVAADARAHQMVGDELLGVLPRIEVDYVLAVVIVEQVFSRHAERAQQHGRGKLAAPIDTDIEHVARVEFEIDPTAAIRDDSRRVQQLAGRMGAALVVLEKYAGRTMQLRHDDALGAVHHEGAVAGHQRNLAEINFLLLDVLDRAAAVLDVPDDELNLDLERRRVGHAALMAFLDVVLGRAELVRDELERRSLVEILDRKDRLEDRLQTYVGAVLGRDADLQKIVVRALLNLDQIRNLDDLLDLAERAANAKIASYMNLGHQLPHCACATNFGAP